MSLTDLILPYSMWRKKGVTNKGQWKVTSRYQLDTCEGFAECVRITHFAERGPSEKSRHMSAKKFLAEFVYIPAPDPYRRPVPGLNERSEEGSRLEGVVLAQVRALFPETPFEAERSRRMADLERRVVELETEKSRWDILTRPLQ